MFFRVALTSVRLLRASLLCGLVGLGGCDALWGALGRDNPQNCAQPSSTCGSDEVCDTQAQICVSGLALRDVQPWRASTGGGVPITLRGEHFLPGAIVTVDGQPAADVLVRSDSELSFTLPAGQSGAWVVPIAVQNPTGHRAERRDLFAYFSDTPQFSDASFPFGGSPVGMVTGDWNSDTFTDLAFIGVPFTGVPLWPGDGNGGFALSTSLSVGTPAFPPQSIAVLDANRDGKADLAVSAGASISVLTADGRGDFPTRRSVYTGTSVERLAAGDVDGDGLADLLVSDKPATGPSNILLLRGAADGSFANSGIVDTGSYPCALAIADLTGDGVRDLLVGYEDGALHLVRRDVGGSPTLVDIAIPSCQLQNFALADANGDGAGDVVVVCRDRVRVMLSMGQGLFAAQADLLPGPKKGPAAALADLNGDGWLDLVVGEDQSAQVSLLRLLLGDGRGGFATPRDIVSYAATTLSAGMMLGVGDYDRDGKPDIVAAARNSTPTLRVLLNRSR